MRVVLVLLVLLVVACGNKNVAIRLGDVSLGQQLIDLKAAYDAGALDETEYEDTRSRLLSTADLCGELDE